MNIRHKKMLALLGDASFELPFEVPIDGNLDSVSFTSEESQTIPGLKVLRFHDENGVEIHRLQAGFSLTGTSGFRSPSLETAPNPHICHTSTFDSNGGINIGTTSGASSMSGILKLWNDNNLTDNWCYFAHSDDLVAPQASTATSGLAVDVGVDYIRYYDKDDGMDVLVITGDVHSSAEAVYNLAYTHESAIQGVAVTPLSNPTFGITAMADTKTASTVVTQSVFSVNGTNPGFSCRMNTYWVRPGGYDSPNLKVGTNANGAYAEFYNGGSLIGMAQFGTNPGGQHIFTESFPKSFPDATNYVIRNTSARNAIDTTNCYVRTVSSFTAQNRNKNLVATHASEWVAWWVET